ncbi:sulfatase modifying factor 1 [Stenotrophomonas sp. ZAC14D1_NAIMI4_6]|uniref:formylglycine-generating enzyme family protein n=1 Tax=Stenotrophomonas sp. ZAC14D1_NAIMI4_1 TaxID=2072411 RepID=UPI000D53DD1F|nr:SUMF1/EgtB/PvdO family nonheme iron enzyme [Stenotrophomonas sp. ZAC14D1_NAIMI4_1]AWH37347.1 sulfatase modifying factor 1 [Stenotrophomonas sp. ZAC14D1_NAIMI4_6]AWH41536.1 sulfatase modifying factor 1 [Stenotrophomonas sp. ZAC14D1_NAIMI4_1]
MSPLRSALLKCLVPTAFLLTACQGPTPKKPHTLSPELTARVEALSQKTKKDLVEVEGGTFIMGDFGPIDPRAKMPYSSDRNDDVLREVTLSSYALGAKKITYADFDVYTDATGQPRTAQYPMDLEYRNLPDDLPVGVSWEAAQQYCGWVGKLIGRKMELPTEAQWEYAARNRGQFVIWPTDDGSVDNGRNVGDYKTLRAYASKHGYTVGPTPLGQYPPTPLGLYDMIDHGYEWVFDWYRDPYDISDTQDPRGPAHGDEKVQRSHTNQGGSALFIVSMTFTRFRNEPDPGPDPLLSEEGRRIFNPNGFNRFRCAGAALPPPLA